MHRLKKFPRSYVLERQHFLLEKYRIEKHFPCFRCELRHHNLLICYGSIIPSDGCDAYKLKIEYRERGIPKIYITDPFIEPNPKYHIYRQGHLCLYDYRESPWMAKMCLYDTIIPWAAEWLVFYEIWKLTGEWLGPEAVHGTTDKKPDKGQIP